MILKFDQELPLCSWEYVKSKRIELLDYLQERLSSKMVLSTIVSTDGIGTHIRLPRKVYDDVIKPQLDYFSTSWGFPVAFYPDKVYESRYPDTAKVYFEYGVQAGVPSPVAHYRRWIGEDDG